MSDDLYLIAPVVLPLLGGALALLLPARLGRNLAGLAVLACLLASVMAVAAAGTGLTRVYSLGNWPAPFGIVLVLDRLAAMMLLLTALLGAVCWWAAVSSGFDRKGPNFHALFLFQLMGLNGAFLTGDLFNLFVFFEVMLIASYGLLLHGDGPRRVRAGLHYVALNVAASCLFLIGASLMYGIAGSLNFADLGLKLAQLPADDLPLIRTAGLLLFVVFALKAAVIPLSSWLPATYSAAGAPVAALFAIMTKVGVYAIIRLCGVLSVDPRSALAQTLPATLQLLGAATLLIGGLGCLAAGSMRRLAAWLVVGSVGTMLIGIGHGGPQALAAVLFYLPASTLACAALFLLADLTAQRRGELADRLVAGPRYQGAKTLSMLFFACAVLVASLPPSAGFLAKMWLLKSLQLNWAWLWGVILVSGLFGLISLSRAGSILFWKTRDGSETGSAVSTTDLSACLLLLALSAAVAVAADPISRYCNATAVQLYEHGTLAIAMAGANQ